MYCITRFGACLLVSVAALSGVMGSWLIEQGFAYLDVGHGLHPMLASGLVMFLIFLVVSTFTLLYEKATFERLMDEYDLPY